LNDKNAAIPKKGGERTTKGGGGRGKTFLGAKKLPWGLRREVP